MPHLLTPKEAEEKKEKKPSVLGTLGLSALGLGTGMLAGAGLGKALEHISTRQGVNLPHAVPMMAQVGMGALGAAIPAWRHYERSRMERASKSS